MSELKLKPEPIEVFVAYSHKDEPLKDELCLHLSNLKRQGKIKPWQDRAIQAGDEWDVEIRDRLEAADIILLLITPRFIASNYCVEEETQRAMERHEEGTARVIPIMMQSCDWEGTPFQKLQTLPKNAKPVTLWDDRDEAMVHVVTGIRSVVESLAKKGACSEQLPTTQSQDRDKALIVSERERSSFITGRPIIEPSHFFGREYEIKRLFQLLKRHPLQNAVIIGPQSSGKTSLLNYLRTITRTPVEQLRIGQRNDWLPNPENYRWIFVDFRDPRRRSREGVIRYLIKEMSLEIPKLCDLEQFMDTVGGNLHFPTIVLMDDISVGLEKCPELDDEFWESLRSLATNQTDGNLAFILSTPEEPVALAQNTGHSSPFFNIFACTVRLDPLEEKEARMWLNSSPLPLSETDIDWIMEQSQCWPSLLQILFRERLLSLEEGDGGRNWKEDGLRDIGKFRHLLNML